MATHSSICLENPADRGAWWGLQSIGAKQSDTTEARRHAQPVNIVVMVSGGSRGAQSYIYTYPFSSKLPCHPSSHAALSRSSTCDTVDPCCLF